MRGIVNDIDQFDAQFFGMNPYDASMMDPQQRIFLECAWEAFEHAGIVPANNSHQKISVFCGMADSSYLQENILKSHPQKDHPDWFNIHVATSMGALSTQISYRLNLRGKSVNVNTACSTSLVAVSQACQDLLAGQSDIALAGSVSIDLHYRDGYLYQSEGIESADGTCRPFDEAANGTVFSDGVGVVILKRLSDAIRDNNNIYAVIKGCGINNDGANKLGYTAPSVDGQIECIQEALTQSGITKEEIGFIEAHGTATTLGDVIEFTALNNIYKQRTNADRRCILGSIKGHIGHTDIAAGMAGLIKTALCLHYKKIPATKHFNKPNPHIDLENSPFYINSEIIDWDSHHSRYAGVSAFGIGGTNAHLILAEHVNDRCPELDSLDESHLFLVSAKTKQALQDNTQQLIHFLRTALPVHDSSFLANVAYSLQTGREAFEWRQAVVGQSVEDIANGLKQVHPVCMKNQSKPIVFMFSGQGTQYPKMALSLLASEPYFAATLKQVNSIARTYLKHDLITVIRDNPDNLLHHTDYTQPALFAIEYALAKLLMHYGIRPHAMIGHSIGEYVAACLAGVFSLEDAVKVVCQRGALMAQAPTGSMISIECTIDEFWDLIQGLPVDLALHNSEHQFVASGSDDHIDLLTKRLVQKNKIFSRLKVRHAFHSAHMASASQELAHYIRGTIKLSPPKIPIISNVTGSWLTGTEATDPDYWTKHVRHTVFFKEGMDTLIQENYRCFIEIGPGQTLSSWTREILRGQFESACITSLLPMHQSDMPDRQQVLNALSKLWLYGTSIDWAKFHHGKRRQLLALPTYAFQRKRYWIEPSDAQLASAKKQNCDEWLYQPSWVRQKNYRLLCGTKIETAKNYTWILFKNAANSSETFQSVLQDHGITPIVIEAGTSYSKRSSHHYVIDISNKEQYEQLFHDIKHAVQKPVMLVHWLSNTEGNAGLLSSTQIDVQLNHCFYSALSIVQAYIHQIGLDTQLNYALIGQGTQQVSPSDVVSPINSCISGIHHVLPREHPSVRVQLVDIGGDADDKIGQDIFYHCATNVWTSPAPVMAIRNGYSWQRIHVPVQLMPLTNRFKDGGVYLCTGGLGGIALTLCETIAKQVSSPTFVLLSRREFPPQYQWNDIAGDENNQWHSTLRILQRIQTAGASIEVIQCDIARRDELQRTIHDVMHRYGKLNGVIHAAGIAGGTLIQRSTKHTAAEVLMSKVHGTYLLAQTLSAIPLDFVMLCSSLSAVIGTVGRVDYAGANACLDAFAESHLFNSKFVVSINWNAWKSVGMAVNSHYPIDIDMPNFVKENTITPEQAQQLFRKIVCAHVSNVAISSFDIDSRSRHLISIRATLSPIIWNLLL